MRIHTKGKEYSPNSESLLNRGLFRSAIDRDIVKINTAYILGAGFSHNAGMPIQSEFLKKILQCSGSDKILAEILLKYVSLTYAAKQVWLNKGDSSKRVYMTVWTSGGISFTMHKAEE